MALSLTPENKNNVSLTLEFRHGKAPTMSDLANKTFTDTLFGDTTQIKDVTFNNLTDMTYTLESKNNILLTNEPKV